VKECNIDKFRRRRNAVHRESDGVQDVLWCFALPQTEVVSKVEEGGDGRARGNEEDFEGRFLGVGQGAALDAVCALEVCRLSASLLSRIKLDAYRSSSGRAAVCTCRR
jgi:hypothetical protein